MFITRIVQVNGIILPIIYAQLKLNTAHKKVPPCVTQVYTGIQTFRFRYTPDGTPETRGRRVGFFSSSGHRFCAFIFLFVFVHILFVNNTLICLFNVSILLAWKMRKKLII